MQKLGVKKGTKVGLFMPNCPTFIVYYFATLKAGGTVVNYNPLYTLEELTFQVKDSETELMVTLDLKLLFDKVEGLMKAGTLKRAIVASFPALLPGAKSVLFKLFKSKDLAHPTKSPVAANVIADADVRKNDGKYQKPAIDPLDRHRRAAIYRRHHRHPQGRHAHPLPTSPPTAGRAPPGPRTWWRATSACWRHCRSSTSSP